MPKEISKPLKKPFFSVVMLGGTGTGKSTIMERLIYSLGGLDKRMIDKYDREFLELGKRFAWPLYNLLDKRPDEKQRGFTI